MIKNKKKLIQTIALLILFCIILSAVNIYFTKYATTNTSLAFEGFYEYKKDTLDIVYFGNSHSYRTVMPAVIDCELNVDSYHVKSKAGYIEQIEYQIKEVFNYQNPRIIIVEMFALNTFKDKEKLVSENHWAFDTMRLSKNKIDAINANVVNDSRLHYILPIVPYHLRWKEGNHAESFLNFCNLNYDLNPYNGYIVTKHIYENSENDNLPSFDAYFEPITLTDDRIEIFNRIVQMCDEHNTKLILMASPYINQDNFSSYRQHRYLIGLSDYVDKNNIDIINYNLLYDEINFTLNDLSDKGHLNIGGSYKVSSHLSEYIKSNYNEILSNCKFNYSEETCRKRDKLIEEYNDFILDN